MPQQRQGIPASPSLCTVLLTLFLSFSHRPSSQFPDERKNGGRADAFAAKQPPGACHGPMREALLLPSFLVRSARPLHARADGHHQLRSAVALPSQSFRRISAASPLNPALDILPFSTGPPYAISPHNTPPPHRFFFSFFLSFFLCVAYTQANVDASLPPHPSFRRALLNIPPPFFWLFVSQQRPRGGKKFV